MKEKDQICDNEELLEHIHFHKMEMVDYCLFRYCVSWTVKEILYKTPNPSGASLIAQLVKNLPAMLETPVRFLGQEDPLEKG